MKTSAKVLQWSPRIICILAILFISLFALDSFSPDRTVFQNAVAFLIHLIPSFVLLVILIIAWKWEKTGGIILIIAGLVWCIFVFTLNLRRTHSFRASLMIMGMLCLPFVISGILFIISHNRKKKELGGSFSG
jgi:prolipoprotein diacylglyceryltransferase